MSALVIVDVQHDFLPGGALAVSNGTDVISPIAQLLREHEWPVVVASKVRWLSSSSKKKKNAYRQRKAEHS